MLKCDFTLLLPPNLTQSLLWKEGSSKQLKIAYDLSAKIGSEVQFTTEELFKFRGMTTKEVLVSQLQPKVTHLAIPCSHMCVVGCRDLDPATKAQNAFTYVVASHQHVEGRGVSIENPGRTLLLEETGFIYVCGAMELPKPGWNFDRSHGCHYALACPT